jgi:hypothetical protein
MAHAALEVDEPIGLKSCPRLRIATLTGALFSRILAHTNPTRKRGEFNDLPLIVPRLRFGLVWKVR